MKKLAVLVVTSALVTAVGAQEMVGTLKNVSGTVSISGKNIISKAKDGMPLTDGAAVLISSTGKATVSLTNGCAINLGANQHLTVNSKLPCGEISASVKQLFPAYQVAQAPIGAGLPPAPPSINPGKPNFFTGFSTTSAFAGVGISGFVFAQHDFDKTPVSGQ